MAKNKKIQNSKRDFLSAALGLGLMGALSPFEVVKAGGGYKYLPPGFRPDTCKDYMLIAAFESMYFNNRDEVRNVYDILTRGFGIKNKQIDINTPTTEPAYWFAVAYFNHKFQNAGVRGMIDYS